MMAESNTTHDLTHLDLFSGIGGFALAARNAGFRTVGFSEVEPYACRVLAERFPGVPNLGDVRKRESFAGLGPITILTGGFPCQPWSLAGKQRGTEDHRHLWPAMLDVVEEVGPSWVIGENVPGLIALGLDNVFADLAAVGYESQGFIVPACAVGAPHRRDRLWIVAHALREGLARQSQNGGSEEDEPETFRGGHFSQETLRAIYANPLGKPCSQLEPALRRTGDGLPCVVDRLRATGNAIVPQVVEPFFHWIRQIERGELT